MTDADAIVAEHRLTLVESGPDRLAALLAIIEGARASLRLLYYIYVDDAAGRRVRDALLDALGRGVSVALLVDGLGSEEAAESAFFDSLRDAGARVHRFVPRWGRRYLLRNHQKFAIADEARVLLGGFNISVDYFARIEADGWRDLGLRVDGPAAARLAGYHDALMDWTAQPHGSLRQLRDMLGDWSEEKGTVRWLMGGPTRHLSPWARAVKRDMNGARAIDLIAGYFAPSPAMLRRLDRVGERGRARIVLPAKTDHGAAIWASRFTYAGLLRKGVRLYEYQPTKLHTKLFVIDDAVHIGSANFDIRSLFLNLELMIRIEDAGFAAHVRDYVEGEVARSDEVTRERYRAFSTPWRRVKQAAAYFVMAVLDYNVTRRLNFGDD